MSFGNCTIIGKLVDEQLQPVSKAKLIAHKQNETQPAAITITNDEGNYQLFLDEGIYSIQVASQYYTLVSTRLNVQTEKELQLDKIIAISKRRFADDVLDNITKSPIVNCEVKAYLKKKDLNFTPQEVVEEAITDKDGKFELLLFPGIYVVTFTSPNHAMKPSDVIVE